MGAADFNGDGHPDVIWQDPVTGRSQVWFVNGAQGTTMTGAAGLSGPNAWRIVGVADLDGDGHPDLIWQDPATGTVRCGSWAEHRARPGRVPRAWAAADRMEDRGVMPGSRVSDILAAQAPTAIS